MSYNEEYKSILSFPTTDGEYDRTGEYVGISNGWFRKTEDPIYILRKISDNELHYEAISLFFDDKKVVVIEHWEIGEKDLEDFAGDEGDVNDLEFMIDALNHRFGDLLYHGRYYRCECEEINEFLEGLGIFATLNEEDFEYM